MSSGVRGVIINAQETAKRRTEDKQKRVAEQRERRKKVGSRNHMLQAAKYHVYKSVQNLYSTDQLYTTVQYYKNWFKKQQS